MVTVGNKTKVYPTWYEFKKDLERRLGRVLHNTQWLSIKPRDPLPWSEAHINKAFVKAIKELRGLRHCPRCGGRMFVEADTEAWYEECLQCSYSRVLWTIKVQAEKQKSSFKLTPLLTL